MRAVVDFWFSGVNGWILSNDAYGLALIHLPDKIRLAKKKRPTIIQTVGLLYCHDQPRALSFLVNWLFL